MRNRTALGLLVALFGGFLFAAAPAPSKRLIVISWDGAPAWVVDKLLQEGKLPALAKMAMNGVHADFVTPATFPSKTAPGHAAIWTGADAGVNGVTGNTMPVLPRREHTLLESADGFDSRALRAQPIWMSALLAGKTVAALSAIHTTPATPFLDILKSKGIPQDRYASFDGFRTEIAPAAVLTADKLAPAANWTGVHAEKGRARELSITLGDTVLNVLVFDAADDPVDGFDTVRVCPGKNFADPACATLKPGEAETSLSKWSRGFRVTKGDLFGLTYFRLFSLSRDGGEMTLYQRDCAGFQGASSKQLTEQFLAASGGFADWPFTLYDQGAFGPQIWLPGTSGVAERRLMEIVRFGMGVLDRGMRFAVQQMKSDLIIHYAAASDSAGHTWMGVLDPASLAYDPVIAAKIWPFYAEVFQMQDAWVGSILNLSDRSTTVSLVSDHGMAGIGKLFYPNAVLEQAGLLTRTADGRIDLTKTKVCAPPWGDYFVSVNSTEWKGGIVLPTEREKVIREATEALLNAVDLESGKHIVTRVFRPEEIAGIGMGGDAGGDLYLDFAEGYGPTAKVSKDVVTKTPSAIGLGTHGFYPQRMKMQTVWFLTGPGVVSGKTIGSLRQVDIAPTLSRLFDIPTPANATGHVIGEALLR